MPPSPRTNNDTKKPEKVHLFGPRSGLDMRVACAVSPPSRSASRGRLVGRVKSITTYPLKGARGESLRSSRVEKGSSVEDDRAFALLRHENIDKRWSPCSDPTTNAGDILRAAPDKDPGHHSNKHLFHQLITDPSLAKISAKRVGERGVQIVLPGSKPPRVLATCLDVLVKSEREPVERFFSTFLETASGEPSKPPKLTFASGHSFANVGGKPGEHVLHINATPSLEAAWKKMGRRKENDENDIDESESLASFAKRFRPNLVVEDAGDGTLHAFDELSWCGRCLYVGDEVEVRVNEPTIRCPSTRAKVPSEVVTDDISDEATFLNAPVDVEGVVPDLDARVAFPDLTGSIFGRPPTRLAEKGSYFGVYATVVTGGSYMRGTR